MSKILIVPFSYDGYLFNSGSERLRCTWLAPYLKADIYDGSQEIDNYDTLIFQKCFMKGREIARNFKGFKIFDVCDPDWLFRPQEFKEMMDLCDVITASSEELAKELNAYYIPDRLELEYFEPKKLEDRKPWFVWFGYSGNFQHVRHLISEYDPTLIISDQPVGIGRFIKWGEETWLNDIKKGDIVLSPKVKYKSDNKTITAWALGLPVAKNEEDIKRFRDYKERIKESEKNLKAIEQFNIKYSAEQFYEIIKDKNRKGTSK